jgi:hypothetical protein
MPEYLGIEIFSCRISEFDVARRCSEKGGIARLRILVDAVDEDSSLRRFSVRGSSSEFEFYDIGKCGLLWYDYDLSEYYFRELFPDLVCGGQKVAGATRIRDFLIGLDERFDFSRAEFVFDHSGVYVNISDNNGNENKLVVDKCSLQK